MQHNVYVPQHHAKGFTYLHVQNLFRVAKPEIPIMHQGVQPSAVMPSIHVCLRKRCVSLNCVYITWKIWRRHVRRQCLWRQYRRHEMGLLAVHPWKSIKLTICWDTVFWCILDAICQENAGFLASYVWKTAWVSTIMEKYTVADGMVENKKGSE